jgi:hypothetical protein
MRILTWNLDHGCRGCRPVSDGQWVCRAPLAEQLAGATVADVLPEAQIIEVRGEINEDWLRILRIRRVFSGRGDVLFDVAEGDDDRRIEDTIDQVNADYLDLLLDLTGDLYMGDHTLEPELNAS